MSRIDSIIDRLERGEEIDSDKELILFALELARSDQRFIEEFLERENIADGQQPHAQSGPAA